MEDMCPHCGEITFYENEVVVIISDEGVESDGFICESCGASTDRDMTGWYGFTRKDNTEYVVPYTQLEEIEEVK